MRKREAVSTKFSLDETFANEYNKKMSISLLTKKIFLQKQ